ncbi:MAG: division/cell wall cluster transcriptional repressor MraZ [Desulfobacterales bacterium]|nr:division/cell wall cluster transcriptional repressor MraZ [Desulfobacterales bacterium]
MFRGSSFHTIDKKGRIVIPTRFKDSIKTPSGDGVIVTAWDECLYSYSFERWYEIEAKILSIAETNDYMRRIKRFLIGHASECFCDSQGRILIPPSLRMYAKLEKNIALVGVLDHFEIWSSEILEKENMKMNEDREKEQIKAEIAKLGL